MLPMRCRHNFHDYYWRRPMARRPNGRYHFRRQQATFLQKLLYANNITFHPASHTLLSKALPRDEELDTLYVTSEKAGLAAGWEFINGFVRIAHAGDSPQDSTRMA